MGIFDFLKKNKNIKNDNGLNETYYDNGKGVLAEKFYKKNGKLDGLYEFYHRFKWVDKTDYHLELVGKYKNGQKEGIWKWYFKGDEKEIRKVGKYKNGQKEGIWKKYGVNSGGELYLEIEYNYKEGKLNGISKYNIKGRFVGTYQEETELKKYKNGEIVYGKTYEFVKDDINEIIFGNLYYEWYRNGLVNYYENGELTKTIPPKITPEQLMKKYGLDADDFIHI